MTSSLTPVQQRASSPDRSVWLGAHAGTGKTKVLVDRMLRLLLGGAVPGSILAITYTKAAAAEMQLRIRKKLAAWSALEDEALNNELRALLNRDPNEEECYRAQHLLLNVIDDSYGLNIQTIHGFCQSLLSRFPVEAGLSGPPQVMDDRQTTQLLQEVRQRLLTHVAHSKSEALQNALRHLVTSLGDASFDAAIGQLIKAHEALFAVWEKQGGMARYHAALCAAFGLQELQPDLQRFERYMNDRPIVASDTSALMEWLEQGGKNDQKLAASVQCFQDAEPALDTLLVYVRSLLSQKLEPKKLVSDALAKSHPDFAALIEQEQGWAYRLIQNEQAHQVVSLSQSLAILGEEMLALYRAQKDRLGLLDYQDLIERTIRLLSRPGYCEWVMSRLDRQLQHILLDEAQDTNPLQWELLRLLIEELFVPELYEGSPRTLFVVGDKKQSIYRFQGADPEGFMRYGSHYAQWFAQTEQAFDQLTLDQSFRSTQAVLGFVDTLIKQPMMQEALCEIETEHAVFRGTQPGVVELWPLAEIPESKPILPPWEVSEPDYDRHHPQNALADRIAAQVKQWLDDKRWLASKQRPVQPGDILILVRRRNAFVNALSRRLQQAGIPIAGSDRIRLQDHLAVQDMLALAQWCLLSTDDLSLATILKSPLFEWDEQQLFEVAYGRKGSLWQTMQSQQVDAVSYLQAIQEQSWKLSPFEWLCYVLDQVGMAHRLRQYFGDELHDILLELKRQALLYEQQETPSLQGFVSWMQSGQFDIKREQEQEQNALRIMTIHGAKGLQAPIVFLPDTTQTPTLREVVLWAVQDDMPLAFVAPQGSALPDKLVQIKKVMHAEDRAEYARLLYVALTRAEDELYLCGYPTRRKRPEDCWYEWLDAAIEQLGGELDEEGVKRYAPHQAEAGDEVADIKPLAGTDHPDWLDQPLPPAAAVAISPLTPSGLFPYEHDVGESSDGLAMARGNVIHHLLQLLPTSPDMDAKTLRATVERLHADYPSKQEAVDEVIRIHRDPTLGWLFGPNSRAEVTLQGNIHWQGDVRPISGQIDRLINNAQELVIIDYKTNRLIPNKVPEAYAYQLAAYRVMLEAVYPDQAIRAALLWTAEPVLQWLDDTLLETLCRDMRPSLDSSAA